YTPWARVQRIVPKLHSSIRSGSVPEQADCSARVVTVSHTPSSAVCVGSAAVQGAGRTGGVDEPQLGASGGSSAIVDFSRSIRRRNSRVVASVVSQLYTGAKASRKDARSVDDVGIRRVRPSAHRLARSCSSL